MAEVRRAPNRRLDNSLSQLYDAVCQLKMHATIIQDLQRRWSRLYWQCRGQEIGIASGGIGLSAILSTYGKNLGYMAAVEPVVATIVGVTVLATGGLSWYHGIQLREWEQQACTTEELSAAFQRTHAREISEGDEYTAALWQRVRGPLCAGLQRQPIQNFPSIKSNDLARLDSIIGEEIPALRRLISPSHFGKQDVL